MLPMLNLAEEVKIALYKYVERGERMNDFCTFKEKSDGLFFAHRYLCYLLVFLNFI